MTRWLRPASAERKSANWYTEQFYREIVRLLDDAAGLRCEHVVAELGCDLGLLARHLEGRCRLVLVDLSDERKTPEAKRCEFHQGSAEAIPLAASSIDLLLLISVYHHLSDFDRFTSESARVLKPGGLLALVEPVKHHPTIMLLNALAALVHRRDSNLREPYGLALGINERFIVQRLSASYRLTCTSRLDNFLWGMNPFLPRPVLKGYAIAQRMIRFENARLYLFRKLPAEAVG